MKRSSCTFACVICRDNAKTKFDYHTVNSPFYFSLVMMVCMNCNISPWKSSIIPRNLPATQTPQSQAVLFVLRNLTLVIMLMINDPVRMFLIFKQDSSNHLKWGSINIFSMVAFWTTSIWNRAEFDWIDELMASLMKVQTKGHCVHLEATSHDLYLYCYL